MADGGVSDFSDALELDNYIGISSSKSYESDFAVIPEPEEQQKSRHFSDSFINHSDSTKAQLGTAYHVLKDANAVIQKKLVEAENNIKRYAKRLNEVEKSRKQILEQYSKYMMDNPAEQEVKKIKAELKDLLGYVKQVKEHGPFTREEFQQIISWVENLMRGEDVDKSKVQPGESEPDKNPASAVSNTQGSENENETLKALQTKLRSYESEILLRKQESDIVHEQLNSLQDELPKHRKRIESLQRDLKQERETRSREKAEHLKKISEMEGKVKEFEEVNNQLMMRVKNLTTNLKELDTALMEEQEMNEDYKKRYLKLGTEFEDVRDSFEKKIQALEAEVASSKQVVQSAPSVHTGTSLPSFSEQVSATKERTDREQQTSQTDEDTDLVVDCAMEDDIKETIDDIDQLFSCARERIDEQKQLLRTLMERAGKVSLPKPPGDDTPLSMPMQEVDQHGGTTVYPPDPVSLTLKKQDKKRSEDVNVDETLMEAVVKPLSELDIRYPPGGGPKKKEQSQPQPQTLQRYPEEQPDTSDEDLYGAGRIYQEGETKAPPGPVIPDRYTFHPRPDELRLPVEFPSFSDEGQGATPQGSLTYNLEGEEASESEEATMMNSRGVRMYQPDGQDAQAAPLGKPIADGLSRPHPGSGSQVGPHHDSNEQPPINPASDWQQAEHLQHNYWQQTGQEQQTHPQHQYPQLGHGYQGYEDETWRQDEAWRQDARLQENVPGVADVAQGASGEDIEDVRECPICFALFPHSIAMNDFSAHVNDHFTAEEFQIVE